MFKKLFLLSFSLFTIIVVGQKPAYQLLVGTYTADKSEGIYTLSLDKNGKILSQKLLAKTDNPSFLAFSPDRKYVYAVNESANSAVTAFQFDKYENTLTFLNKINLGNAGPCYVAVTNKHVITANYGNGAISVLARKTDGLLTDTVQTIVHQGKRFAPKRFGASHVHQTLFSPDGKILIATNLGKDCIYSYSYHSGGEKKPLELLEEKVLTKNSGPRHAVFTRNGKYIYLLGEMSAGITVLEINKDGKLNVVQEISVVNDTALLNGAADIHLSPDEKFLYATNRGDANDITCFKAGKNGRLTKLFSLSTGGIAPRNFAISPDGNYLLIGNQKTDNISVFRRDNTTGKLRLLSEKIEIGAPVCLLFY